MRSLLRPKIGSSSQLVMAQTYKPRDRVIRALEKHPNDILKAIVEVLKDNDEILKDRDPSDFSVPLHGPINCVDFDEENQEIDEVEMEIFQMVANRGRNKGSYIRK